MRSRSALLARVRLNGRSSQACRPRPRPNPLQRFETSAEHVFSILEASRGTGAGVSFACDSLDDAVLFQLPYSLPKAPKSPVPANLELQDGR